MLIPSKPISRRALLKGAGVTLALTWLEAMGPLTAWAEDAPAKKVAPNRMAFLYVPNGKHMPANILPPVRDYYRVEDDDGGRFWLFRDGSANTATWYLHGFCA